MLAGWKMRANSPTSIWGNGATPRAASKLGGDTAPVPGSRVVQHPVPRPGRSRARAERLWQPQRHTRFKRGVPLYIRSREPRACPGRISRVVSLVVVQHFLLLESNGCFIPAIIAPSLRTSSSEKKHALLCACSSLCFVLRSVGQKFGPPAKKGRSGDRTHRDSRCGTPAQEAMSHLRSPQRGSASLASATSGSSSSAQDAGAVPGRSPPKLAAAFPTQQRPAWQQQRPPPSPSQLHPPPSNSGPGASGAGSLSQAYPPPSPKTSYTMAPPAYPAFSHHPTASPIQRSPRPTFQARQLYYASSSSSASTSGGLAPIIIPAPSIGAGSASSSYAAGGFAPPHSPQHQYLSTHGSVGGAPFRSPRQQPARPLDRLPASPHASPRQAYSAGFPLTYHQQAPVYQQQQSPAYAMPYSPLQQQQQHQFAQPPIQHYSHAPQPSGSPTLSTRSARSKGKRASIDHAQPYPSYPSSHAHSHSNRNVSSTSAASSTTTGTGLSHDADDQPSSSSFSSPPRPQHQNQQQQQQHAASSSSPHSSRSRRRRERLRERERAGGDGNGEEADGEMPPTSSPISVSSSRAARRERHRQEEREREEARKRAEMIKRVSVRSALNTIFTFGACWARAAGYSHPRAPVIRPNDTPTALDARITAFGEPEEPAALRAVQGRAPVRREEPRPIGAGTLAGVTLFA